MRVAIGSWMSGTMSGLLLSMTLACGTAFAADKTFEKKFSVDPGGTLTVDTDMGTIVVNGTDVREVTVRAAMSGTESQLKDFDFNAEADSRGVTVRGQRYNDWWLDLSWLFGGDVRIKYEIQVPHDYHVELRTSGGMLDLQNLKGTIRGHTSGGRLRLKSVAGDIDLHTSGGGIQAEKISGVAQLRTSGGTVTVDDTDADLNVRTSGGSIRLRNIQGKVDARTSGGSIDAGFRGDNRGSTFRTSGGSIRIAVPKDFKATIDARTSGGSVKCELPLTTRGGHDRNDRNQIFGDINGGGESLSARTSGGSIRIRASE
jgi:DUF4097 and DUF4098 domain-containing protein YvlB